MKAQVVEKNTINPHRSSAEFFVPFLVRCKADLAAIDHSTQHSASWVANRSL